MANKVIVMNHFFIIMIIIMIMLAVGRVGEARRGAPPGGEEGETDARATKTKATRRRIQRLRRTRHDGPVRTGRARRTETARRGPGAHRVGQQGKGGGFGK